MADSRSALAKAILGFKGATAGQKEHEDLNRHLERVHNDFLGGRKGGEDDSPGKREARGLAFQHEIPSERTHEGGDGQVKTNDEHGVGLEFARDAERPGVVAPDKGGDDRKMTSTAGVHSDGHGGSNLPSGPGAVLPGAVSFRTIAAKKAGDKINEPSKTSGGNRKSVNPAPAAGYEPRVGEAPAPGKAGPDTTTGKYEEVPQFVAKERLGRDSYERAAEGVRKLLKAPRR